MGRKLWKIYPGLPEKLRKTPSVIAQRLKGGALLPERAISSWTFVQRLI